METTKPDTVFFYDPFAGRFIEIPILPEDMQGTLIEHHEPDKPDVEWEGPVVALTGLIIAITGLIALLKRKKDGS